MDSSSGTTPSSSAFSSLLPASIHATNSIPDPPLTITRTFFQTSTLPPVFASHPFSPFSTPSFLTIPYTDITVTTQITLTTTTVPTSTSIDLFPHDDDDGVWHHLFPALIFFALIGMLATLTFLVLFAFCLHRRRTRRREPQDEGGEKQPPAVRHTPDRLAISDNPSSARRWKETGSPTFVPIETSPLTLVSRAAIWQDPARRRGVNELDLWERKQLHQPPSSDEEVPTTLPFHPSSRVPQEDEEDQDEEEEDEGSFDADDRPWQKYMRQRSPPPLSDLAQAITLAALDEDDQQSIRSLNTTRETLRPLSYLHQDVRKLKAHTSAPGG